MQVEHHDLHHEFPEFATRISDLKAKDAHFLKLFNEYDGLDHRIRGIENAGSPVADTEMEALKLHRVRLKDELYHYLRKPD